MKLFQWPGIIYKCYRNSYIETSVVVIYNFIHKLLQTWNKKVTMFIVFTEFYKKQFIEYGLVQSKVAIKCHFISEVSPIKNNLNKDERFAVYIGRLMEEKGILLLMESWDKDFPIQLKIRGDGKLKLKITKIIESKDFTNVEFIPRLSEEELKNFLSKAEFLIWPSTGLYETFGLVAIEAYMNNVAVIGANAGVMKDIVKNYQTGILFNSGDEIDLKTKIVWAIEHPYEMKIMGLNARKEYEEKYTAEINYKKLIDIYQQAIENQKKVF